MKITEAKIGMTVVVNDSFTGQSRGAMGVITGFSRDKKFISARMYRQATRRRMGRILPKGELNASPTVWHPAYLSPVTQAEMESRL